MPLANLLTVDVEDYYHVSAFARVVSRDHWDSFKSRVERNTDRILAILEAAGVRATFFVLGWLAERHPDLVRRIAAAGHELACHSHSHRLVYDLTPDEFREDTRRAKAVIESAAGVLVVGYRAPSFSITKRSLWALAVLAEEGFVYDASIFPIHHDRYGIPSAPRHAFVVQGRTLGSHDGSRLRAESLPDWQRLAEGPAVGAVPASHAGRTSSGQDKAEGPPLATRAVESKGDDGSELPPGLPRAEEERGERLTVSAVRASTAERARSGQFEAEAPSLATRAVANGSGLLEIPASTLRLAGQNWPIGGGGYLRILPYAWTAFGIRHLNLRERQPAMVYLHPWELDPDQPRLHAPWLSRFRHYRNLHQMEPRLRRLLADFRFAPIREVIDHLKRATVGRGFSPANRV